MEHLATTPTTQSNPVADIAIARSMRQAPAARPPDLPQVPDLSQVKVAVVHEWLETYAGSERVVEQILHCFPQAAVFAVVDFMPAAQRGFLNGRRVTTSFIQKLPLARRCFRSYLGLMPFAVEQFDLTDYQLVISSSHAVAKGIITGPDQLHVSYVHSPMRYAWDLQHQYLRQAKLTRGLKGLYARWLLSRMRQWDVRTAPGVDVFVANSTYIGRRIRKAYWRESEVIHPPVDVEGFPVSDRKADYYFVASRLVPYKRIDLIAAAFAAMPDRKLIIVGDGPELARVTQAAANAPNISLRPPVGHAELVRLMQSARAFVVAAEEDFGITMVEAQACGTPVISFGRGGARDIIVAGGARDMVVAGSARDIGVAGGRVAPTGLLFDEQSAEAIIDAVKRFERLTPAISPEACRANALRFSADAFRTRLCDLVASALRARGAEASAVFPRALQPAAER